MEKIKVLIVDDQVILRDGLKTILETEEDIHAVGTAGNGLEALEFLQSTQSDIVLLDIRMPQMNGVECTKAIKEKYPHIIVLMLTTFDDEEYIINALNFGASGYLLKDINADKLVQFIRDAISGGLVMPSKIAVKLAQKVYQINHPKKSEDREISPLKTLPVKEQEPGRELKEKYHLSDRELEVAAMLIQGFTNSQIAEALYVSVGTIRNYVSSIYNKIGIYDRTNAVIFLKDHGLI
ncbi:MAG: response regulator transcription factor [Clostridia bacterium]|nr:response regulator transcription factor [Clostridia bacterium]